MCVHEKGTTQGVVEVIVSRNMYVLVGAGRSNRPGMCEWGGGWLLSSVTWLNPLAGYVAVVSDTSLWLNTSEQAAVN